MKLVLVIEWDVDEDDPDGVQKVLRAFTPPDNSAHGYIAIKEKAEEVLAVIAC